MGLRSPYGRRGAICEKYGWTWDYLHHGIAYAIVERMLIDASWVDYDTTRKGKGGATIAVTNRNAKEIMAMLNKRNK